MTENRKQEAAELLAEHVRGANNFTPALTDAVRKLAERRRVQRAKDGESYDGGGTPIRGLKAAFSDDRVNVDTDIHRED